MARPPPSMPLRVVVDSNVIISAIHVGGNPGTVIDLGRRGTIDLYVSPFILDEVAAALAGSKFRWVRGRIAVAIAALPARAIDPGPPNLSVVSDAPDNRILECAVAARAQYLVTGDRELLTLGTYRRLHICTPRDFLGRVLPS